jgi:integration host factor subunit alpha
MSQEELLSLNSDDNIRVRDEDLRTTTRADLAEAIYLRTGVGRADAAKYVEMVLEEIFERIVAREDVKLSSFGAFLIRAKRERQGRNPKTGEAAKITARLVVTFKPSNILRARINNGLGNGMASSGDDRAEAPNCKAE